MIIINAENKLVGRFATIAAKQALLGQDVVVINCEKAYVSGPKPHLKSEFIRKEAQGEWARGPHYPRQSDRIVKRMIRGMIPYKSARGRVAYQKVMCYNGIPAVFADKEYYKLPETTDIKKLPNLKYTAIGEISKLLGAKIR